MYYTINLSQNVAVFLDSHGILRFHWVDVFIHFAADTVADDAGAVDADPVHMYYVNDGIYGSFVALRLHQFAIEASVLDVSILFTVSVDRCQFSLILAKFPAFIGVAREGAGGAGAPIGRQKKIF